MLAVSPFCCSDLCAVLYDSCITEANAVKAVRGLTRTGKSTSRARSSSSGCSCSAPKTRGFRGRDDEEEDGYYYDTY